MKIAIDARKLGKSGIGVYIKNLVNELAIIDRENEYILVVNSNINLDPLPGNFKICRIKAKLFSILEHIELPLLFLKERVGLFHSTHFFVPLIKTTKYIVTIHDLMPLIFAREFPFLKRTYLRFMISRAIRKADLLIADSKCTRDDMLQYFKEIDPGKIHIVHIAPDKKSSRIKDEGIMPQHDLVAGGYILYVGSDKYNKNLAGLIKAYALLEENNKFPLVLAGKIDKRFISQPGVRFLGQVDDAQLDCLYRNAIVFVMPSLYEGFGLPILEAMACGTPVITANKASTAEIAGNAAVLVNPDNAADIARALRSVISDRNLRENLIEKGLRRAAEFSWGKTAEETLKVYQRTSIV